MTREERARKIFETEEIPIRVERDTDVSASEFGDLDFYLVDLSCTTEAAVKLSKILPPEWLVVAPHPEFLGWDVAEIASNLEEML